MGGLFGMDETKLFKMLQASGVKIKFVDPDGNPIDGKMVIGNDSSSKEHEFSDVEKMVNG